MSRRAATEQFTFGAVQKDLERKGVRILSAGVDEVPGVYKNIEQVMTAQSDLVEKLARFDVYCLSPRLGCPTGTGTTRRDNCSNHN